MNAQKSKQNQSYVIAAIVLVVGLVVSWYVSQFFVPLSGLALVIAVVSAIVVVMKSRSTKS